MNAIQWFVIGIVYALTGTLLFAAEESAGRSSMDQMQVACVQLKNSTSMDENLRMIVNALESESKQGTRLVAFPETVLTSYVPEVLRKLTQEQIDRALAAICEACRKFDIYAVVGSAFIDNGQWYNGAYIVDSRGKITKRYTKLHVVNPFFKDGNELAIFYIDDVPTTIMICHDERYPEVFRIPVLAGAKVGIYISAESKTMQKRDNYRCQLIARAVENQISIIHCNEGEGEGDDDGDLATKGSHGHSRIIDQAGNVLAEATGQAGQAIRAVIHPKKSSNAYAIHGSKTPCLQKFWAEGLRVLKEQNPEFFAKQPPK